MSLWRIIFKNLQQHLLSTTVTALSIAMAGGLLMAVWVVKDQSQQAFTGVDAGFDAVLGARGSKLQLVLNSIFHLEQSPGNIPWTAYESIRQDPAVAQAVAIAVGDNYRGYRLTGVTTNLFDVEYAPGKTFAVQPGGRIFHPDRREAVVGSFVAARTGLGVGDHFHPYHGLTFVDQEEHTHEDEYVVVGVMQPSNTPADRVIWIPVRGLQLMEGHSESAADEISAVLLKLKSPMAGQAMNRRYNQQGSDYTFAWPIAQIMARLFDKISWFDRVLTLVAYLVAVVATGSVLASIYNSMNDRRREIAVMRALGARRQTIFSMVVLEAAAIAALGMIAGFVLYAVIGYTVASVVRAQTGVVLETTAWHPVLLWAPAGMILLSALAGVVPALKAYRTDVAANLQQT